MDNTIDYVGIGRRIRLARQNINMTQFTLAELSSLTQTNISHIERATHKVSLPALVLIANVLQVSIDYLLYDNLEAPKEVSLSDEPKLIWEVRDCTQEELDLLTDVFITMKKAVRKALK